MKPAARIEFNGKDVTTKWVDVLESITITDEAGIKADTCEIAFDNGEGFSAPPEGAIVKIWLGYEPKPIYMGSYKVDTWTKRGPPKRLSISAKAADLTSEIRAAKIRSFHEQTVGEIVEQIAADNGLKAVVDEEIAAREVEHIDQQTESDMSFLSRLAKRQGATFKLADGKILFAAKGSERTPSGKEKTPVVVNLGDVSDWEATQNKRGQYKSASAHYMDHVAGKRKTATAGTGKPCHRDRRLYGSRAEAQAAAEANLGDLNRGQMTVSLTMKGTPEFYAEALVELKGFDADVDGQFLAKSVTHSYSDSSFITTATLETKASASATETDPAEDV